MQARTTRRRSTAGSPSASPTWSGFTRLTRRLEEDELGELVEAFETTAADLVAAHGGRLIKTLGDEVLFVADDPGTAAEIGLRLIETMTGDETMPELRVGMAFGTVDHPDGRRLRHDGQPGQPASPR